MSGHPSAKAAAWQPAVVVIGRHPLDAHVLPVRMPVGAHAVVVAAAARAEEGREALDALRVRHNALQHDAALLRQSEVDASDDSDFNLARRQRFAERGKLGQQSRCVDDGGRRVDRDAEVVERRSGAHPPDEVQALVEH